MSPHLPAFTETPVASIAPIHARLNTVFMSGVTRPLEYRKVQLRRLYHAMVNNRELICAALKADLNKPTNEAAMAEYSWIEKDIMVTLNSLDEWAKDEPAPADFMYKLMRPRLQKNPLGTVLVIGAFNYPFQICLIPLMGAIAAGCTAVVKPSEMAAASAAVIAKIIAEAVDPDAYVVVNGGIPQSTALLECRWDKILYTGNGFVGRIIASAAAKFLTPVALELGGLNPVFITSKADAKLAAKRIAWGKITNCGQICIAPNYVLLEPSVEAVFVKNYVKSITEFYPNGTQDGNNYARIINDRHFKRITGLLEKTKGKVVYGGRSDAKDKWIEPTLIRIEDLGDSLLSEEIFGPLLPYMAVRGGLAEMVQIVRAVGDTPLALYAFTKDKKEQEFVERNTRSGGITFNDVMFHAVIQSMPFGGVGESGTGAYRGRASFDVFTHARPIVNQPSWLEGFLKMRYPPYTDKMLAKFLKSQRIPPVDFDRNGRMLYQGFLWKLALLGGPRPGAGLRRWVLAFLGLFVFKTYLLRALLERM